MTERRFDTGYWNDPDILELPMSAKLLYIYLWNNRHCNQAGLYEIALKTITFETGLTKEEITELLSTTLTKKVTWVPEQNLVWVKNFLRRQSRSPTFLAAAANCLENISNNGLVKDFLAFNAEYNLSIPYRYPSDRVEVAPTSTSISLSNSLSSSNKGDKGVVKGDKGELSDEDKEIMAVWQSVSGFAMELPAMVELLSRVRADFPDVDIVTESRKWAARKISEPLTPMSRPSSQIYNFMATRHKWNKEQSPGKRKPKKGEFDNILKFHADRAKKGKSMHEILQEESDGGDKAEQ